MNSPEEVAKQFIRHYYPNCILAVLGGSVSTKQHDEASDLDIVVVMPDEADAFRRIVSYTGWLIECTFLTLSDYRDYFDDGIQIANPALQRIISEGIVLFQKGSGPDIIQEAKADLAYGPMVWSHSEIHFARYMITDKIMDLIGNSTRCEKWFIVSKLVILISEFVLRTNQRWVAEGKHLYRTLRDYDADITDELERCLDEFYAGGDAGELIELCKRILEPYGGLVLEGYEEG